MFYKLYIVNKYYFILFSFKKTKDLQNYKNIDENK